MENQSTNALLNLLIFHKAADYLKHNPERFTSSEKDKFIEDLKSYVLTKDKVIADEVFDFYVSEKLAQNEPRTTSFIRHLIAKYNSSNKVLDVGAGRMCHLSTELGERGFKVVAIDPKIRLKDSEIKQRKIQRIIKQPFYCDEYGNGTDISNFDLLVGLEPCDATEHIIRQGLKYEKPFEVSLCYQAHNALNGKTFATPEDWYEYLQQISNEINITRIDNDFIASRK